MLMLTHIERESSKSGRSQQDGVGVSWTHDGQAFVIQKREQFVGKILPLFFAHTKFPSFTRKLYRWGFRKILCIPEGRERKMDELIFAHPHFKRDEKSLMANMRSVTAADTRRAIANLMKKKTGITVEKAAEKAAPATAGLKKPTPQDQHEKGGTAATFIFGASSAQTGTTSSKSASSSTSMMPVAYTGTPAIVGMLSRQQPVGLLVTTGSSSSSQQSIEGGHHVEDALHATFSRGEDSHDYMNDFEMRNDSVARTSDSANHVDTTTSRSLPRQHGGRGREGQEDGIRFDISTALLYHQQTSADVSLLTRPFHNPFRPQSHIMLGSSASSWPRLGGQTGISPMIFPGAAGMARGSYPSAQHTPHSYLLEDVVNNNDHGTSGLLNAPLWIQQMRQNQRALLDRNTNGLNASQNPGDASSANGDQEEQNYDRRYSN